MRLDLDKSCKSTVDWLQHGFRELRSQLAYEGKHEKHEASPSFEQVAEHFFRAVVTGHHEKALELTQLLKADDDWLKLVRVTCEKLEKDWQVERLSLSEVSEGFRTTQRIFKRIRDLEYTPSMAGTSNKKCLFWVQPGDLHLFGAQILAQVFEHAGWSAGLVLHETSEVVLEQLAERRVDVLGVSIGCDEHLLGVADFLTEARIRSLNPSLIAMVGGAAIEGNLSQYRFLGADFLAKDADSALVRAYSQFDA